MSDIVDRARQALEGVTEGPWQWERNTLTGGQGAYGDVLAPGPVECMSHCYGGSSVIESDNPEPDRQFIAAARTLVPELADEVERLRAQLDGMTEERRTPGTSYNRPETRFVTPWRPADDA